MNFTLATAAPFSLQSVLRSHGWVQLAPFSAQAPYQEFTYVYQLENNRVISWRVKAADGGARGNSTAAGS